MTGIHRCDTNLRCTFVVFHGSLSPEEREREERRLFSDPAFPPGPGVLLDLSTVRDAPGFTPNVVSEIATRWHEPTVGLSEMRLAIVAKAIWNEAKQFEHEVHGWGVRVIVFPEVEPAALWLGKDPKIVGTILGELRAQLRGPPTTTS